MKIRFVVIPPDEQKSVEAHVTELRNAVDNGNMDAMDLATDALLNITSGMQRYEITEDEWHSFLSKIREANPAYKSDYLLPGEVCVNYFPDIEPDWMVLQFPIDEEEA